MLITFFFSERISSSLILSLSLNLNASRRRFSSMRVEFSNDCSTQLYNHLMKFSNKQYNFLDGSQIKTIGKPYKISQNISKRAILSRSSFLKIYYFYWYLLLSLLLLSVLRSIHFITYYNHYC